MLWFTSYIYVVIHNVYIYVMAHNVYIYVMVHNIYLRFGSQPTSTRSPQNADHADCRLQTADRADHADCAD